MSFCSCLLDDPLTFGCNHILMPSYYVVEVEVLTSVIHRKKRALSCFHSLIFWTCGSGCRVIDPLKRKRVITGTRGFRINSNMISDNVEVEDFIIQPISRNFICVICESVLVKPMCCHEGHSYCNACIRTWLSLKNVCPVDRGSLTQENLTYNRPLENVSLQSCFSKTTFNLHELFLSFLVNRIPGSALSAFRNEDHWPWAHARGKSTSKGERSRGLQLDGASRQSSGPPPRRVLFHNSSVPPCGLRLSWAVRKTFSWYTCSHCSNTTLWNTFCEDKGAWKYNCIAINSNFNVEASWNKHDFNTGMVSSIFILTPVVQLDAFQIHFRKTKANSPNFVGFCSIDFKYDFKYAHSSVGSGSFKRRKCDYCAEFTL